MDRKSTRNRGGLLFIFAVVSTLLGATASSAATITYTVDQTIGAGSVVGVIQTDGKTGVLGPSDFIGWALQLNGVGASFNLTNLNSGVYDIGSDVTATAKYLFFDFSGTPNDYLLFQVNLFSGQNYYCDAVSLGTCDQGATVTPQSIFDPSAQNVPLSGNQIIGTSAVPEPSTWAMLLIGFAGLGFAAYRQSRKDRTAPSMA